MTDIESFLAAIEKDPLELTTRKVFADWIDDHPEQVPESASWSRLFRLWTLNAIIADVVVTEETKPLFNALCEGATSRIITRCVFKGLRGDGIVTKDGDLVFQCEVIHCGGYGIVLTGNANADQCIFEGNVSGNIIMRNRTGSIQNSTAYVNAPQTQ